MHLRADERATVDDHRFHGTGIGIRCNAGEAGREDERAVLAPVRLDRNLDFRDSTGEVRENDAQIVFLPWKIYCF